MDRIEPVCLDDIEEAARKVLPKTTVGYYASGTEDEKTVFENREAFRRIKLRPRMLRGISQVDMRTTILGDPISMPVCIAPTALHKCAHPDGEAATAKAAAHSNSCMVLSLYSMTTLEEVAVAAPNSPKWFLMYNLWDKELMMSLIRRAENAGYKAIVLCVDSPEPGSFVIRSVMRYGLPFNPSVGHRVVHLPDKPHMAHETKMGWETVDWLRSVTRLPVVLKGILTAEDAKLAVEHGVDGIIVSNHGGRQLNGTLATIDALAEIVNAVQGKLEVYMDGGVRLGTDVLKALALGARAVFIGRPVIWGLAYKGEEGVKKVLDILKEEFRLAMLLSGCGSLADISKALVTRALPSL